MGIKIRIQYKTQKHLAIISCQREDNHPDPFAHMQPACNFFAFSTAGIKILHLELYLRTS